MADATSALKRYETEMFSVAEQLRREVGAARLNRTPSVGEHAWVAFLAACQAIYEAYETSIVASIERGEIGKNTEASAHGS
jgi:hypothetical protein